MERLFAWVRLTDALSLRMRSRRWAFTAYFEVWTMFGVTGIPIHNELNLNSAELGLLAATPILTGALLRLPLGLWTDRFGGRIVMLPPRAVT
jgi:nitrate/nitrite transporter NarK